MPRVYVESGWIEGEWVYRILNDDEVEDFWDEDGRYRLHVIEIPASRLKYHKRAMDMYAKAQQYLDKCVEEADKHPERVMRFD